MITVCVAVKSLINSHSFRSEAIQEIMSFDLGFSENNQLFYGAETWDLSKVTRREKSDSVLSRLFKGAKYAFFEGSEFNKIDIIIKFSNFKKLEKQRLDSLNLGYNLNPNKIPAKVRFGNKTYSARVSLKGDLNSHFVTKKRMSLWVEIKDGYVRGFNKFALTRISNRQFPHDHVFQTIQDKHTFGVEHFFLNVSVNGESWGIMNAEPSLTPQYLEKKGIKSPFAIRLGNDEEWLFGTKPEFFSSDLNYVISILGPDKKLLRKKYNRMIYSRVQAALHDIDAEKINYKKTLDAFIQVLIWGNHHAILPPNIKYVFNKYSNKFEPFLGDQDFLTRLGNRNALSHLITKVCIDAGEHIRRVLCSKKHKREELIASLNRVSVNPIKVEEIFNNYYDLFPNDNFRFDASVYGENLTIVNREIDFIIYKLSDYKKPNTRKFYKGVSASKSNKHYRKISGFHFDDGKIFIKNLTNQDITIKKITSKNNEDLLNVKLPAFANNKEFEKQITTSFLGIIDNLKIHYEYDGELYKETIYPTILSETYFANRRFKLFDKCSNKNIKNNGLNNICIITDDVLINENYLINQPLLIKAGVRIHFENEMSLITTSDVEILGEKENPVKFIGNSNSGGIYFNLENVKKSKFKHVEFINLGKSFINNLGLTGAVNVFSGDVFMDHVSFINTEIEDAINFNYSNIDLTNIYINKTLSDGIDCDFCWGKIIGLKAKNIGGDAIDFSGSKILMTDGLVSNVYDKGISVGEQSSISIQNFIIENASFGIAVKDSSYLTSSNSKFVNNKYFDLMSYQKKPFFSKSLVQIDGPINSADLKVVCQYGENLSINKKTQTCSNIDVDNLYSNTNMKKSNAE